MAAQISRFNRLVGIVAAVLFVISLGWFTVTNWRVEPEHVVWMTLVNALILSIPLLLFYGAAYVLASAWNEHRLTNQVNPRLAKIITWAPRIAAVLIVFFISLFSLDVFAMPGTFLEKLGGFIIHSLPSLALILLLVVAWKRPVVGFGAFLLAGLVFLRFVILGRDVPNFFLFSGPLFMVAALFYASWRWLAPPPARPLDAVA